MKEPLSSAWTVSGLHTTPSIILLSLAAELDHGSATTRSRGRSGRSGHSASANVRLTRGRRRQHDPLAVGKTLDDLDRLLALQTRAHDALLGLAIRGQHLNHLLATRAAHRALRHRD